MESAASSSHFYDFLALYVLRVVLELLGLPQSIDQHQPIFWGSGFNRIEYKNFDDKILRRPAKSKWPKVKLHKKNKVKDIQDVNAFEYLKRLQDVAYENLGSRLDIKSKDWMFEQLALVIGYACHRVSMTPAQTMDYIKILTMALDINASRWYKGSTKDQDLLFRCKETLLLLYQKLEDCEWGARDDIDQDSMRTLVEHEFEHQLLEANPVRAAKVRLVLTMTPRCSKPVIPFDSYLNLYNVIEDLAKPIDSRIIHEWRVSIEYLLSDRVSVKEQEQCVGWFRTCVNRETRKIAELGFDKYIRSIAPALPKAHIVASYIKKMMFDDIYPALIPSAFQEILLDLNSKLGGSECARQSKQTIQFLLNLSGERAQLIKTLIPLINKMINTAPPEATKAPETTNVACVVPFCGKATRHDAVPTGKDLQALLAATLTATNEWNSFVATLIDNAKDLLNLPDCEEYVSHVETIYRGALDVLQKPRSPALPGNLKRIGSWIRAPKMKH